VVVTFRELYSGVPLSLRLPPPSMIYDITEDVDRVREVFARNMRLDARIFGLIDIDPGKELITASKDYHKQLEAI